MSMMLNDGAHEHVADVHANERASLQDMHAANPPHPTPHTHEVSDVEHSGARDHVAGVHTKECATLQDMHAKP